MKIESLDSMAPMVPAWLLPLLVLVGVSALWFVWDKRANRFETFADVPVATESAAKPSSYPLKDTFKRYIATMEKFSNTNPSPIPPTRAQLAAVSGENTEVAEPATYTPHKIIIKPHEMPPKTKPQLLPVAVAGTGAAEIMAAAAPIPSVREQIRSEGMKGAQNPYEAGYEFVA